LQTAAGRLLDDEPRDLHVQGRRDRMVDAGPSGHHFTMVTGGGYTRQYHWYSLITIDETTGMAPQAPRSPERAAASKCGTIIQDLVVDTTDFADKKLSAICAAETAMRQLVQEMRAYLNRHGLQLPWIAAEDKQAVRVYAERQTLSHDRRVGARFGLGAAELFHYLSRTTPSP
jgi:hypothetical protein